MVWYRDQDKLRSRAILSNSRLVIGFKSVTLWYDKNVVDH
jgi:hypothetical protein